MAGVVVLSLGCAKSSEETSPAAEDGPKAVVEKALPEEGLVLVEVDLDINGVPDIFNYYRERDDAPRLLVKKEVDLNYDGRVDVVSYFDIRGDLEREEMDGDFDGTFDTTDYYKNGSRVMSSETPRSTGVQMCSAIMTRPPVGAEKSPIKSGMKTATERSIIGCDSTSRVTSSKQAKTWMATAKWTSEKSSR